MHKSAKARFHLCTPVRARKYNRRKKVITTRKKCITKASQDIPKGH